MISYWQYIYYCLHTKTAAWRKTLLCNNAGNHLLYANRVTHTVSRRYICGGKQHADIPQVVPRYTDAVSTHGKITISTHPKITLAIPSLNMKNTQHLTFTFHQRRLRTFPDPSLLELRHAESWSFPVRSDILLETVDRATVDRLNCSHVGSLQLRGTVHSRPRLSWFFSKWKTTGLPQNSLKTNSKPVLI